MKNLIIFTFIFFFPPHLFAQSTSSVEGNLSIIQSGAVPALVDFRNSSNIQRGLIQMHGESNLKLESYFGNITFRTGTGGVSSDKMIVRDNGNVGIGTLIPDAPLHLFGGAGPYTGSYTSSTDYLIESNSSSYLRFNSSSSCGISFASASNLQEAGLQYTPGPNSYVDIRAGGTIRMTVDNNGNVGVGVAGPNTRLHVNGFTRLGNTAPKIQMKELSGNAPATQGAFTVIPHGLDVNKIMDVSIMLTSNTLHIPPNTVNIGAPGYEYSFHVTSSGVIVHAVNGNSLNILNDAVRIIVTYKE